MKFDEGKALAVFCLQEGWSSGQLLSRPQEGREVGDLSEAVSPAAEGSQSQASEACLVRRPVGMTSLLGLPQRGSRERKRQQTGTGLIPFTAWVGVVNVLSLRKRGGYPKALWSN